MSILSKDIFSQLKSEHDEVKDLFEKAEEATESKRSELVEKIEKKLVPHARGEEKTLYAVLRERVKSEDDDDALDLTNEAYEEHRVADELLKDLKATDVSHETWLAKLKVLKENIEHHIEEEEKELFKEAKKVFSSEEQKLLLEAYTAAKEGFEESLPTQGQIAERKASAKTTSLVD